MTLSPGDTIQIILTLKGVPYAKTRTLDGEPPIYRAASLMCELLLDIAMYADEHEHEFHCAHDESRLVCLRCDETRPLGELE